MCTIPTCRVGEFWRYGFIYKHNTCALLSKDNHILCIHCSSLCKKLQPLWVIWKYACYLARMATIEHKYVQHFTPSFFFFFTVGHHLQNHAAIVFQYRGTDKRTGSQKSNSERIHTITGKPNDWINISLQQWIKLLLSVQVNLDLKSYGGQKHNTKWM